MPAKAPQTVTFAPPTDAPSEDSPHKVAFTQTDAGATFAAGSGERYERQRVLGQGGMGTVVLVRDRTVGRFVALKQLNDDEGADEESLARFAREARVQGQLEHPAIVPVYDAGTGPDRKPFFTMKRVRGQSLQEVLALAAAGAPTGFSRRKLLSAFSQLCAAAHYAHERGVVHRDIKPTNIMLGAYGEVYLLDWGVAKVAGEPRERQRSDEKIDAAAGVHTGYGAVVGTLTTMAPEQAVGGEVDARTDVYALGAVLFEILTLQAFHPKGEFDEVVRQITTGVEARPSVRAPGAEVPPELEQLCVEATRLQPADRLASAMILRERIESYLDGDRDLELRRRSAREHAEAARAAADEALGDGGRAVPDEEAARSAALGEVGKALALDPDNKDALGTLVRLLTSPPTTTPRDVAVEQKAAHRKNIRRGGIAAAVVYGYISLNALSTWRLGVHDVRTFAIAHVLWALAFVASVVTVLRPSYATLLATFALGLTTSAYVTRVYGPYILVSTLITMHAVLFAFVRDWKPRLAVIGLSSIAWTLSVFGDSLGVFPEVVRFADGDMTIRSSVLALPATATTVYLYAAVLASIVAPAVVVGALRSAYQESELAMRLQSWQLRRLVAGGSRREGDPPRPRGRIDARPTATGGSPPRGRSRA
ncbi:MAG: serine/threonine protein kinase [Labilithrix sp.]|nr:serine/threonine protein kinase [Labilithrix sp.]